MREKLGYSVAYRYSWIWGHHRRGPLKKNSNVVRKKLDEEYKEDRVSSPQQDFILFLIYCVVMRTNSIVERHYRLYIGNGNWVTLPRHVSDDLQTIYKNGLSVRYVLGPGLTLDILPNDMDCNSRTACLPGLMRVDLCYNGRSNTEASQQALSRYIRQLLESQGTMDAFPPPALMRCTRERLAENEEAKEEENEEMPSDVLTMPHVLSLPTHRHLSLVPPLPPTGPSRRRIATTLPSRSFQMTYSLETGNSNDDDDADNEDYPPPPAPPFSYPRKRPTTLPPSQIKRRQLHSSKAQCLTTTSTGPRVPPTATHYLHHPENAEKAWLSLRCGGSDSGNMTTATYHNSNLPPAVWSYMGQAANDMMQYNVDLPISYFPHHHHHHHGHPLTPGEHPSVAPAPGNSSSSMATTYSYPLSDLSSPPESVVMRHNSMDADIETHYEFENMIQSQLSMVDNSYFVSNGHV